MDLPRLHQRLQSAWDAAEIGAHLRVEPAARAEYERSRMSLVTELGGIVPATVAVWSPDDDRVYLEFPVPRGWSASGGGGGGGAGAAPTPSVVRSPGLESAPRSRLVRIPNVYLGWATQTVHVCGRACRSEPRRAPGATGTDLPACPVSGLVVGEEVRSEREDPASWKKYAEGMTAHQEKVIRQEIEASHLRARQRSDLRWALSVPPCVSGRGVALHELEQNVVVRQIIPPTLGAALARAAAVLWWLLRSGTRRRADRAQRARRLRLAHKAFMDSATTRGDAEAAAARWRAAWEHRARSRARLLPWTPQNAAHETALLLAYALWATRVAHALPKRVASGSWDRLMLSLWSLRASGIEGVAPPDSTLGAFYPGCGGFHFLKEAAARTRRRPDLLPRKDLYQLDRVVGTSVTGLRKWALRPEPQDRETWTALFGAGGLWGRFPPEPGLPGSEDTEAHERLLADGKA